MTLVRHISKFEDLDVNEFDKHPFPNIAKKAIEAKARKSQVTSLVPTKSTEVVIKQLTLWGDEQRWLPNEMARSALFNAKNRKQCQCLFRSAPQFACKSAPV